MMRCSKIDSSNTDSDNLLTLEDLHDENAFWKVYTSCGIGQLNDMKPEAVAANEKRKERWFRFIDKKFSSVDGNGSAADSVGKDNENEFWDIVLKRSTKNVIVIHIINVVVLLVITLLISLDTYVRESSESRANSYQLVHIDIIIWGMLSIVVMTAVVMIRFFKDDIREIVGDGNGSDFEIWRKVGNFLLMVRFLLLVTHIAFRQLGELENCSVFGTETGGYHDITFQVTLMRSAIDAAQTVVFSTISFPLPYAAILCTIELFSQIHRFFGCSTVLFGNGQRITYVSIVAWLAVVAMYAMICLNTTVILLSTRNFFQNKLRLALSAAEKRRFVDLLCSEIRSPLQNVVGAVGRVIDAIGAQTPNTDIHIIGHLVTRHTQLINLLSDNLLYLTKVEEGRALTTYEKLNLQKVNMFDLIMKNAKQLSVIHRNKVLDMTYMIFFCQPESAKIRILSDFTLLTILVRNLICFGAIMMDDMTNETKTPTSTNPKLDLEVEAVAEGSSHSSSEGEEVGYLPSLVNSPDNPLYIKIEVEKVPNLPSYRRQRGVGFPHDKPFTSRLVFSLECPKLSLLSTSTSLPVISPIEGDSTGGVRKGSDRTDNSGEISVLANKETYSTVLMTCKALTSRVGGYFKIERHKVMSIYYL